MEIKYLCPNWGQAHLSAQAFLDNVLHAGYDGIEVDLPDNPLFGSELKKIRKQTVAGGSDLPVVAQMVLSPRQETVAENIARMLKRLEQVSSLQPVFINSQSGKDFFSFDDNCRIIEAAMNYSVQSSIAVLHETHRGKFSFHLASLLPYLKRFPEMLLTADFSHFCVVSESLLEDQEHLIEQLIPHVCHIHARVGFSQAAQVNDPMAPEWKNTIAIHKGWWQKIVNHQIQTGAKMLTITPEFGPAPYMPALPFTQQPIGNQWLTNIAMMNYLKNHLKTT